MAPGKPKQGINVQRFSVLALSSALGLGYVPVAPGTFGTLGAIPLWWALSGLSLGWYLVALSGLIGMAVFVASRAEKIYGRHDAREIVIDEVVGLLVAGVGLPFAWPYVVAAVVAFRLLDILKPPPIRHLDRHVGGGFGVVIDDVVAGLGACAIVHLGRVLVGVWW